MKEVDLVKRNRRILSVLLAICLFAALIPTAVFAEVSMREAAADDQVANFAGKDWLVIDNNANELVLLLKTPEAPIAYNASGLSNIWDSSDAKTWCESDEVRAWFSDVEWNALSDEKVFFLSHAEVVTYWSNNSADSLRAETGWWLRYDGENVGGDLFGIAVSDAGFVGTPHVATNYGARPAIKIPASNIAAIEDNAGKWNLKIINDSAFNGLQISVNVDEAHTKATATYSGASNGKAYIVLTDRQGNVLKSTSADINAASGAVELALPADLMGWYTVRAFIADGNVASAVVVNEFAIEDSHGNVVEWNVNVGGDISANFNIELSDEIKADENAKVTITYNGVTTEIATSDLQTGTTTGGAECVKLPVDMLAPQMNDEITIQVVAGDGRSGGEQTFTIREYAEAIVNGNFSEETKQLAKHMLNYGAKSQTYFNHKADDLANKNVGVPQQISVPNEGKPANKPNTVADISFYGASLVLNSQTTLRFYFTLADGANIDNFNFGALVPQKRTVAGTAMYFVDIVDIAPDKLNETYSVSVNGVEIVSYNPMWYIQRQYHSAGSTVKFKDLLQAMYNYYLAADAYVN